MGSASAPVLASTVVVIFGVFAATAGEFVPQSGAPPTAAPYPTCPEEKFNCRNGKCISGYRWCDGIDNCGNNADELTCRICVGGAIKCKNSNQCVPQGSRCNGKTECVDGSDELGCEIFTDVRSSSSISTTQATTAASAYNPEGMTSGATMRSYLATIVLLPLIVLHVR